MKITGLLVFLLIGTLRISAQTRIDVLHYQFYLELNDRNNDIAGKTDMEFISREKSSQFSFELAGNSGNQGMIIDSIRMLRPVSEIFTIGRRQDKVTVTLPAMLAAGDTCRASIWYHGVPSDGLIISKNKFGNRTFFADNWPDRAHNWIPCNDRPDDKASFEFIVTAPDHYQVISNGVMTEESSLPGNKKLTHWNEDIPLSTKVMVIGVADFAVNYSGYVNDCIPVSSWVFPENRQAGFYDYALAKDILAFYISYIGPYPYKKLANVQSKTIFGGMENAGAIFYHENSVVGHREEEMLFAHEIVHQWFGDMASETNYSHLWLSEGFATYLSHIYTESRYGLTRMLEGLKNDRAEVTGYLKYNPRPVVDSVTPRRQLINTNNYARAGWVLHMLRRKLGDSVFHAAVRNYYEAYKGRNASTEDLRAVFENTSHQPLDSFFRQWLYTPVIPKLSISWKYNGRENNVVITVSQLQPSAPFHFPLDVWVQGAGGMPETATLAISRSTESFTVPVKSRPIKLIADPLVSLLYEGTVTEIK